MQKNQENDWKLAHEYSSDSAQWELSNEYQHDRVYMILKNLSILVLMVESTLSIERVKNYLNDDFS